MDFWKRLDDLLASHEIFIERPKGSRHNVYPEIIYPLDYGCLKGTSSGDGKEVDVWKGSIPVPLIVAVMCTVDSRKNDTEVKLLVGCTSDEIEIIREFHNKGMMSGLMVTRH